LARTSDRRDLSMIRESGSTARVLNLAYVAERHGDTPEYAAQPLFRNKRLNRAVIIKHAVRPHERGQFSRPVTTATKVVLPFASQDLRLGGASFFVGQNDMERLMRETVGGYGDADALAADMELLAMLDSLPSFDPFLMRERLRRAGISPARCYFDVTDADLARMRSFVTGQIAQLVELAFASEGAAARDLAAKLADKLMTDETAQSLEPLRQTLAMSGEEYREGVFAWKGFLYYKWMVGEFAPRLAALAREILSAKVLRATAEERAQLGTTRQQIVDYLGRTSAHVQGALDEYDAAYVDLANGRANAFRDFLLRAPAMFLIIGEAVGTIKHVESFWRFRFPKDTPPLLEADEAFEVFHEFETTLGGLAALKAASAAPAA
jgi:CRP-like cAMP-binding protein